MAYEEGNTDTLELLNRVKALKFFTLEEDQFWLTFLKDIAFLHSSLFALILVQEESGWRLKTDIGLEKYKEHEQEILRFSVNVCSRALKNSFSYERARGRWIESANIMGVGIKIDCEDENIVLFLPIEYENSIIFNNSLARLTIFSDIYLSYKKNRDAVKNEVQIIEKPSSITTDETNFKDVAQIVSLLIYQKKFLLSAMTLCNELSLRFGASKVSLGWKKGQFVETIAISHLENFTKNSKTIDSLEALFEECFDQNEEIHFPNSGENFLITDTHNRYAKKNGVEEILSLPFRVDNDVKGVLVVEKKEGEFSQNELILLRLIANQVTPILEKLFISDRNFFSLAKLKLREKLSWWFGVDDTFLKFAIVLASLTLIFISSVDMEYKIESTGALTTDNISFVSSPFEATVFSVEVHSGDLVKSGDHLLSLETKELYLKYSEAISDVARYSIEEQKARGANELADMQIASAKVDQSLATKERIEYYLNQSKIRSPLDGVIVEGDHEELLGKPVNKGDLLFKIAKLSDFYLTLQMDEEYVDEIKVGDSGEFIFLSKTAKKIAFVIDKIIPLANVNANQKNSFVVKAHFMEPSSDWWRPGMSGVAKIDAGERKIIWVLTHKFIDTIRLFFWI